MITSLRLDQTQDVENKKVELLFCSIFRIIRHFFLNKCWQDLILFTLCSSR
jgi:hypothetical protein